MSNPASLVVLPGALGAIEDAALFRILECERKLVPIDYRADDDLDRVLGRIAAAAEAAGAGPVDVLGQSYGGWVAQCFASRFPGRVRRLVLSHTFILRPGDSWRFLLGEWMLRLMPARMLERLAGRRVRDALEPVKTTDPQFYRQLVARFGSQDSFQSGRSTLVAQQRVLRESCGPQCPGALSADLPVLIIESDNDPMIDETARARLRLRYPGAKIETFRGTGHTSALVTPRAYAKTVLRFLA